MHYFVDGYNLLFYLKKEGDLQENRNFIMAILKKISLRLKATMTIVFDGKEENISHVQNIKIVFTEKGESADDFILKQLELSKNIKNETVVTSDKSLTRLSRSLGAKTLSIYSFLQFISSKKSPTKEYSFEDSQENIERLLKIFKE